MIFENPSVDLQQLPHSEDIAFQRLASAYLKVSYIGTVLFFVFLLLPISVLYLAGKIPLFLSGSIPVVWLLWFGVSMWFKYRGFQVEGFAMRERDIIHRKGVIFRRTTVIPFNRVQHCEVKQGPIERYFNLHSLEVYTAGGASSDLKIPGLEGELAQQLKDFIIKRTSQHDPR